MTAPIGTAFELSLSPFYSRITSLLQNDPVKNYYTVAFNPGYPLQASELNEMQELFFINSTLSSRIQQYWISDDYGHPFWEGLVPLKPDYIILNNISLSGQNWTGSVTISDGWYYWNDINSKLSFWIYNDTPITGSISIPTNTKRYIGVIVDNKIITCCSSNNCSETQDTELRDNSSGTLGGYLTCGASRLSANINSEVDVRNFIPTVPEPDAKQWRLLFSITTTDNTFLPEYITTDTSAITIGSVTINVSTNSPT